MVAYNASQSTWAIASASISGWRSSRGEPQPEQRAARSGTSRRQSRQKPGMVLSHVAPPLTAVRMIRSRRVALPTAPGHGITRLDHLAGVDRVFRCKRQQQRLVGREVIEHAEEKLRLARGRADGIGADSGYRQEAAEPLGLAGDETERGNGKIFGRRLRVLTACGLASLRHRISANPALHGRGGKQTSVAACEQGWRRLISMAGANQVPRRQGDMSAR